MSDSEQTDSLRVLPDPTVTRGLGAEQIHPVARLPEEWAEVLEGWGERAFRGKQVFKWIHEKGVLSADNMSNLGKSLRARLGEEGMAEPGSVSEVHQSSDGTRKLLLELDRKAKVECVLIPMTPGGSMSENAQDADETSSVEGELLADRPRKRVTLCISTQFGCAMGCRFCASGQSGLFRGLGAAEVVYQVLAARRYLKPDEDLRNLVYMGMGEPLHHYEETARSLRLLTHSEAGGMSPRRITVSTVGLVPGIRKLGEDFEGRIGLAVSLHAPNDLIRGRIMPMNTKYPIDELIRALREYPMPPRRRITIEYTLIGDLNDQLEHADELAELLRTVRVKLNLIPMNPIDGSEFKAPSPEAVVRFQERMAGHGYSCFVRTTRGDDVSAACGQLALQAVKPERLVRR